MPVEWPYPTDPVLTWGEPDGLYLKLDDSFFRLDGEHKMPDMNDRTRAIAKALLNLAIERLESG